jgi:hypothetical protein
MDDIKSKTCTIWLVDNGQVISERLSGIKLLDLSDFFMSHPSLMLETHPYDFSTWVVTTEQEESVRVGGDFGAFCELGFRRRFASEI